MGWWENRVVPVMVDKMLSAGAVHKQRHEVCRELSGRVLEVGFGSGLNISHYPEAVTAIAAVEPSDRGWEMSRERRTISPLPYERIGLDGQDIAADDASFDSVLITFSLCTIPDPDRALREVRRLLRPGGRLFFLEHGLSPDEKIAAWQRRLDPIERKVAGGCELSRDIPALVESAGFEISALEEVELPGPAALRPWGHGFRGHASARPASAGEAD
jgi:ubiquinone/menaquinone biosynthesis C-methylase UbiE